MEKKWILPQQWRQEISENKTELLSWLMNRRGLLSDTAIKEFLSEKPQETYDPFLLKGMKEGVELVLAAIQEGKQICIYGDYDADGVTSSSLLLDILSLLTDRVSYYIPSRFEEGYGLNMSAVEQLAEQGVDLLITVDCGSASYEEVKRAQELGMQVMVTDHHSIQQGHASDCIVINPKQTECPYPFKELSGCGVAFKLAQALQRTLERQGDSRISKKQLNQELDLVAISTVGDIVSLVSENRTMVKYGLSRINRGGRLGLDLLIQEIGLGKGAIHASHIAFSIVPHLNAGGRMMTAKTGVELLTGRGNVTEMSQLLITNNRERKSIQEKTYDMCLQLAETMNDTSQFLLINAGDAHEGIAGIVAGKIKERFGKPTVLVTTTGEEGVLKGTGRSVEGLDLFELLNGHRDLFDRFGGHRGACGFSLKAERLERLRQALEADMKKLLETEPFLLQQKIEPDAVISLQLLTVELIKELEKMEPFGFGNEKPIFLVEGLTVLGVRYMGDADQHVRFSGKSQSGHSCDFIVFGNAQQWKPLLESGEEIDVVGYPDINVWNGRTKVQFIVGDGRRSEWKSK